MFFSLNYRIDKTPSLFLPTSRIPTLTRIIAIIMTDKLNIFMSPRLYYLYFSTSSIQMQQILKCIFVHFTEFSIGVFSTLPDERIPESAAHYGNICCRNNEQYRTQPHSRKIQPGKPSCHVPGTFPVLAEASELHRI